MKRLDELVKTVELEPATIANGAVELLNEVSTSKITGEEERYSHIDLVDLVANVEGAKAAFESVETLLPADSPVTEAQMDERFAAIDTAMEPYKDGDGYVLLHRAHRHADQGHRADDRRRGRAAVEGRRADRGMSEGGVS